LPDPALSDRRGTPAREMRGGGELAILGHVLLGERLTGLTRLASDILNHIGPQMRV
jgi:hypothetical protein